MFTNTDRDWEYYGKTDPYFGVLTHTMYHNANMTNQHKEEFFTSGHEHVDHILSSVHEHLDTTYVIKRALDFGCGVGRLAIPLAEVAEAVVGIDVSESMLNEARTNCETKGLSNVEFIKSDDTLTSLKGQFDFIHTYIVFQHIPVKRGVCIFHKLLAHLTNGGVGVVHFTYSGNGKLAAYNWIMRHVPLANNIGNVIRKRNFFTPRMQMNQYDMNCILHILQENNIRNFYAEYSDHGGVYGIVLYFKKPANAQRINCLS